MATEYRFLFADLKTNAILGELPLVSASWTEVLNRPGSFHGSMPLDHGDPTITAANFAPAKTRIYVERDGVIVWGGILWTLDMDVAGNTLSFGCEGFLSYFRRRSFEGSLVASIAPVFASQDQLDLARGLIDYAQDTGVFPGGDIGILTTATNTSGVTRDRTWTLTETVGDALERLAAVDNGFDFRFVPAWNTGTGEVDIELVTYYPATGRSTAFVFDMGANVELLNRSLDGTAIANKVFVTGATAGPLPKTWAQEDPVTLVEYPRLVAEESAPGVLSSDTLLEHANLLLLRRAQPVETMTVAVYPDTVPTFGSYIVGDQVRVKGSEGYLDVDATYRILSIKVAVQGGLERVELGLAPLTAFL